jgi:hypothetical protein
LCKYSLIGIDNVGDFHIVLIKPALDVAAASTVYTRYGDTQAVIGAYNLRSGLTTVYGKCRPGN